MSAKTKIIVVHMKELILAGALAIAGLVMVLVLILFFLPRRGAQEDVLPQVTPLGELSADQGSYDSLSDRAISTGAATSPTGTEALLYIPGVYNTILLLGDHSLEIETILEKDRIASIRLVDPDEEITSMYPLLAPTMESLRRQICEKQSLEGLTVNLESRYTSLVLLEAIRASIEQGSSQ